MEKINIAEILKDCPKGMELDCTIFDDVYFDYIDDVSDIINCYIQDSTKKIGISFSKYGCYSSISKSKCVIFPKGKTTWEGFQRPFEDGDVISNDVFIAIFHKFDEGHMYYHCWYNTKYNNFKAKIDSGIGYVEEYVYATEEEKQKLFDAIKANGYKWNPETKTLEKLIEPKFKVGDRIIHKASKTSPFTITEITDTSYKGGYRYEILIEQQDNFELVPNKFDITTLKPFDKVLVRIFHKEEWKADFFSHYTKDADHPFVTVGKHALCYCIPYENNEHLLGKTDDCDEFYKTWK